MCTLPVVDGANLTVVLEHLGGLGPHDAPHDLDPRLFEVLVTRVIHRPLVEPDRARVVLARRAHDARDTTPESRAEAHAARLAARKELEVPELEEGEGLELLLGALDGDGLTVEEGVVLGDHAVATDRHELGGAVLEAFEDSRA